MRKSNYTIGNRTRDLPACNAVPESTAPPRSSYKVLLQCLSGFGQVTDGQYRCADKSLARPCKETSHSDQDLQHYTKLRRTNNRNIFLLFVSRKSWYSVASFGRCSLFPSRAGLRTFQHPVLPLHEVDSCKDGITIRI